MGGSVADGGITTAKLADGAVTTAKVADAAITATKLASGVGTPLTLQPTSRAESILLQGSGEITSPAYSSALLSGTTSPVAVEFGAGDAEILSVTAGESTVTVLKAGVYHLEWTASVDVTNERPIPRIEIYNSADTIGTATPLARLSGPYIRGNFNNVPVTVAGIIVIPADNTTIKFANSSAVDYSDSPVFSVDTGQKVYFSRGAASGLNEEEVENFVSEHISHTVRRRLRVGGGVLLHGDVRFDATTIEINVSQDTEDGWFGDLEVGAEIRIHGLTSGARSMYTLVSVAESGDDATLTVTRDSHSGIFSHNETVVIVFDQVHAPQADWTETDENRPAYIKHKPTYFNNPRKFFYGEGQSDRDDVQQATGISGGPWIFAFAGGEADEEDFNPEFDVTFTDIDDETDADIDKSLSTSDNHVFAPDAGTYDLYFNAVGSQGSDAEPAVGLIKIHSGTDDRFMLERPGWSAGPATGDDATYDNTYHLEYKSFRVEEGDKFYFQFLYFTAAYDVTGTLTLIKLS